MLGTLPGSKCSINSNSTLLAVYSSCRHYNWQSCRPPESCCGSHLSRIRHPLPLPPPFPPCPPTPSSPGCPLQTAPGLWQQGSGYQPASSSELYLGLKAPPRSQTPADGTSGIAQPGCRRVLMCPHVSPRLSS